MPIRYSIVDQYLLDFLSRDPIVTQTNGLRQFKTSNDILGDPIEIALHKTYQDNIKLFCSTRVYR